MEIDDGFAEFQVIQDEKKLSASFSKARDKGNDLSLQRSKEELIEDYFNFCIVKGGLILDVTVSMLKEYYFIVYASYANESERSQDDLPVRVYSVTLTDQIGNFSQISSNNLQNDQLVARIIPCFSINQHLALKLQSAQLSISKILLLLSDLQTISQKENNQDTASIKSGSRRNSTDNL